VYSNRSAFAVEDQNGGQSSGPSSGAAHVEMMGPIDMDNNPMVGFSVALAVAVSDSAK
jgi:hypothetical protein